MSTLERAAAAEKATAPPYLRELGMVDFRELGCPDRIFQRVLEARAKKSGLRREPEHSPSWTLPERPNAADLL